MGRPWLIVFSVCFLLTRAVNGQQEGFHNPRDSEGFHNPRANLSTSWVNSPANLSDIVFSRGQVFRPILLTRRSGAGVTYACGFYRSDFFDEFFYPQRRHYVFAVVMVYVNSDASITTTVPPQPVWAANRNSPVGENATLEFTAGGNLVLWDEYGTEVWSTSTTGKGVLSMEMLETGNLVLSDGRHQYVWESFSSPMDVLVLGQALRSGMKLISSISAGELLSRLPSSSHFWSENPDPDPEEVQEGSYVLEMTGNTLSLWAKGSPPQKYWSASANKSVGDITPYAMFTNGSILFFMTSSSEAAYSRSRSANDSDGIFPLQSSSEAQYLRLPPNGNLGVFKFTNDYSNRLSLYNVFEKDNCSTWPGSCGHYSICKVGQCSCVDDGFTQVSDGAPLMGCKPEVPISGCSNQDFVPVHVDYIPMENSRNLTANSSEACQQICSNNCSCKMAIYFASACYTFDEVYTLRSAWYIFPDGNLTGAPVAMIKVQRVFNEVSLARRVKRVVLGGLKFILVAVLLSIPACGVVAISVILWKGTHHQRRMEELALDSMLGLPRRFSYKELQQATGNFGRKLGQGGFGTVFSAELLGDEQVAVKRLDNASQGSKDFRTEVSIIGRVRHMNLVQLKGFCAENEYRMLVYELVVNSSLDKWLFVQNEAEGSGHFLDWHARLNIALGVARGLAYLHEGCSEKILHLDVKAQNILLDADMNAKVCDFGLSRLVTRDESSVFTTLRGTPGYMAPEWLQASITEKVDVYSYGVVLLELLSGQKCLDTMRLQEGSSRFHFPSWASQRIAQGGSLMDLLDKRLGSQVDNMAMLFDLALLCTQEEPARRPSMGRVVQVLEDMLVGEFSGFHQSASSGSGSSTFSSLPRDEEEQLVE